MTTHRTRTRVSFAAVMAAAITLGGCAAGTTRLARDGSSPLNRPSLALGGEDAKAEAPVLLIHFDNQAAGYVRVYLVDDKQQWLLGRVERGASASLKIPGAALATTSGWMRLAVVPDTLSAAGTVGQPRLATMGAEPVARILAQRWTFSPSFDGGQLTALPLEHVERAPQ